MNEARGSVTVTHIETCQAAAVSEGIIKGMIDGFCYTQLGCNRI